MSLQLTIDPERKWVIRASGGLESFPMLELGLIGWRSYTCSRSLAREPPQQYHRQRRTITWKQGLI